MGKISKALELLDLALMEVHERIQSGKCMTTDEQAEHMVAFLNMIANKDSRCSMYQACQYLGINASKFRRLVAAGKIPQGKKTAGWKEKSWSFQDLDKVILEKD